MLPDGWTAPTAGDVSVDMVEPQEAEALSKWSPLRKKLGLMLFGGGLSYGSVVMRVYGLMTPPSQQQEATGFISFRDQSGTEFGTAQLKVAQVQPGALQVLSKLQLTSPLPDTQNTACMEVQTSSQIEAGANLVLQMATGWSFENVAVDVAEVSSGTYCATSNVTLSAVTTSASWSAADSRLTVSFTNGKVSPGTTLGLSFSTLRTPSTTTTDQMNEHSIWTVTSTDFFIDGPTTLYSDPVQSGVLRDAQWYDGG